MDAVQVSADALAQGIVKKAKRAGLTVCTAESLTAGMTASLIADIPGASSVLRGGAVTYCDEIKARVLDVKPETLERYTAVSAETAREMADGARELYGADIAVSLTGYAGPDGGTEDDPAGTVYIGLASTRGTSAARHRFTGGRNEVRLKAAATALSLVLREIEALASK